MSKVGEKKNNQKTGAFGEQVTADFLKQRGDEILDRNWRVREGEIDLVSLSSDGIFHFIEVKTRSSRPTVIRSKLSTAIRLIGCNV